MNVLHVVFDTSHVISISLLFIGLLWMSLSDIRAGCWIAIALPMYVIGLDKGWTLAPVISVRVHNAPRELAGNK